MNLVELKKLHINELTKLAKGSEIEGATGMPKQELIFALLQATSDKNGQIYGDAHTWWDQAAGRYTRQAHPQPRSVMVLYGYAGPKRGHLAAVTRVISAREIRVDHANWLNDGNLYLNSPVIDVSPGNDWSVVRVYNNRDGHLGGKNYNVRGFIGSTRVASAR